MKKLSTFLSTKLDESLPPDEVVNVASVLRDKWIAEIARNIPDNTKVLDVGAGQAPYRKLFNHCEYFTQDFSAYEGTENGLLAESWEYSNIDYVCDITNIPVDDSSFDTIICTEVLEHVPRPIEALAEISRILAPTGRLYLSAPLASGLHQQPYHFYGGFTPFFYRKYLSEFGFKEIKIKPTGGLFKHVAQEVYRAGRLLESSKYKRFNFIVKYFTQIWLPNLFAKVDSDIFVEEFTVGYFVEAIKG